MRAVYTALTGGYEALNEQPVAASSSIPFLCFTDDPSLTSETWEIVLVEPALPADPSRSSRQLKLVPDHPRLAGCDQSLWIDNTVVLKVTPEQILDEWLDDADLAIPQHSYRERVIDEFDAVVSAGFDEPSRVYEQLYHYLDVAPHVLEQPVLWNALIARRHTAEVARFGEVWWRHVLRYSRRDQLSVRMALDHTPGVRLNVIELDNYTSLVHDWPVVPGGRRAGAHRDPLEDLKPLAARLRAVERAQQDTERALADTKAGVDDLRAEGDELRVERDALRSRVDELQAHIDDIHASRTWRAGQAIARLAQPWGRRRGGRPR